METMNVNSVSILMAESSTTVSSHQENQVALNGQHINLKEQLPLKMPDPLEVYAQTVSASFTFPSIFLSCLVFAPLITRDLNAGR